MTIPVNAHRFYVNEPLAEGAVVTLPRDRSLQIAKVLRLRAGDEIVLFDGRGGEFPARLIDVSPERTMVSIGSRSAGRADPQPAIHLAPALLKADKFDWVVQKATELGVVAITPVITERTVISLAADRAGRRRERWQRIAIEAAEQSGRTQVPAVADPIPFMTLLERTPGTPALLFWEGEREQGLAPVPSGNGGPLLVLVGPEGGFTPDEVQTAIGAGARTVSLGPLILRSETAAIAGVAMILARFAVEHPNERIGEVQSRQESS
ncbi:16S rRNA (uracil(1498)-N(3))-methyltransferase [Nitrolancea hollandica]|uniref:Ribosomal RNA small subunit methyltransferase E n=1 Tax=Nitrolancea hollandica Lb TaxID=1129897 RepID=I4EN58_9BACT|nr:16S rRNA (uracil(1498)-N(3))-methyltransferase [Nitrolancea hollandica]CCF86121.1 conserved hypothetical protein [Nitrolancea hollandica Lb]